LNKCNWPNVEIHELLHVLGFEHSTSKESLMYPYLTSCDQKLDEKIIQVIKELYSQPNLPDLYFENISANQKGKYLSFNTTIKNIGVVNSKLVNISVLDNGEIVKSIELEPIPYGAGLKLNIQNLKISHLNPEKLELVIDLENKIKEIDRTNNQVQLI
jgi:subtilase family serine protease